MDPNKFEGREKLAYHRDWLNAYRRGDAVTPISMEIDLTNVCNYRCPNCVWDDYIGGNRAKLAREQALSQVHQCAEAGVKAVIFSGGGEPLAHPAALECIQEAKNLGLSVGLFTNAVYVTPQSAALLAQCASWIRVHLDAVSSHGYRSRHGRGVEDLQRVRENLLCLNRYRPKPEIGLGSIVNEETLIELGDLVALAVESGCDYFQAKHDFEMISEDAYAQWWSAEVVPRLVELEQRYAGAEFAIHYTKVNYSIRPRSLRCHIHHLATAINAESQYVYCKRLRDKPEWAAGNLSKTPLNEILRGDKNHQLSREVTPQNCGISCPYLSLNEYIDDLVEGRADLPAAGQKGQRHTNFF